MTFNRTILLSSAILIAGGLSASAAEVVYREVFPTGNRAANTLASTADWNAHSGLTATVRSLSISNGTGRPNNLAGINAGTQASTETDLGYFANLDGARNVNFLYWTEEFQIATSEVESFQWHLGNTSTTEVFRLAIEITPAGSEVGTWFASNATFSNLQTINGGSFSTAAELMTLTFAGAQFNTLAFTPGSSLVLGAVAPLLPEGTITAFGLYTDNYTDTQRFDTFTINAVPEPSVALLGVTAVAFLGSRRRRS